jgi:NADH-quinone oxidoreductase subunit M
MLTIALLILPLLAGLALLGIRNATVARKTALGASVAVLALAATLVNVYLHNPSLLVADYLWIPAFNAHFHLGVDGITAVMLLLSTVLMPFIIASQHKKVSKPGVFYALLFFTQTAVLGVFMALDSFLFYVFWELSLIPIYFLMIVWGEGDDRRKVTLKFFLYTIFGSLLMLVAFAYIYISSPVHSFDITGMYGQHLSAFDQSWLFWLIFLAFAIKTPLFPLHTWMPKAYTQAPMAATMMLSAILSKMGIYGFIRWLMPLVPQGTAQWSWLVIVLAVIGIIYASFLTLKQNDMKTFSAYSSMAHTSMIVAGLFAINTQGMQGAIFQMLVHGINMVGLLYIVTIFEKEAGTRLVNQLGGIRAIAPRLASLFMLIMLGTIALPLTNGFIGEFLLISGLFKFNAWIAAVAGLSIIMGAVYMLYLYQKTMLGKLGNNVLSFADVRGTNFSFLSIIAALIVIMGVVPQPLLNMSEQAVSNVLKYLTF